MADEASGSYSLGRLVLDYIRVFMWPLVALVVVVVYQDDVRKIVSEREVEILGVRIGDKVEEIESRALAEISEIRSLLAEQQRSNADGNAAISQDINTKLERLELNLSRDIEEVRSAEQAGRALSLEDTRQRATNASAGRADRVEAAERRGFEALIDRNVDRALEAFTEARIIWPEYHNVSEIEQLLLRWQDRLSDPGSPAWSQLYREILTRYSWGMPKDLRQPILSGAAQAY